MPGERVRSRGSVEEAAWKGGCTIENLSRGCSGCWRKMHFVPEAAEIANQPGGALASGLNGRLFTPFLVPDAFMQDLPCDPAKPMGHRPDGFEVSQPRDQTTVERLVDAAFGFDCRVGCLTENSSHVPVALRRAIAFRN